MCSVSWQKLLLTGLKMEVVEKKEKCNVVERGAMLDKTNVKSWFNCLLWNPEQVIPIL